MDFAGTTLAALFGSFLGITVTHYLTSRREALQRQFKPRQDAYDAMFGVVFDIVKEGSKIEPDADVLLKLKVQIAMWGSADTLRTWIRFEEGSTDESITAKERVLRFEDVLRAMRRDLGHDDSGIKRGELWALFTVKEDRAVIMAPEKK